MGNPVSEQSGTQSATVGTEHQLGSETTADEVYVAVVDAGALALGDTVKVYAKTKVRSTGTLQLAYQGIWSHAQASPIKYSPPIPTDIALDLYLKQTAGTGRSFPWSLLAIANIPSTSDGSQTATVGTEHQLGSSLTAGGSFILGVDLVNMVNGDYVELIAKTKTLSGGTERVAYKQTYGHLQTKFNVYSPVIVADIHCAFYLNQVSGTGRAFPWKIYTL